MDEEVCRYPNLMITRLLVVLVLLSSVPYGFGGLPKDPTEYATWESNMLSSIERHRQMDANIAIPKLGYWLMQMSLSNNSEKGERPVYHAAQSALLAIPGHADYFVNEVKQAKARALSPEELSGRDGKISWSNYNRVRSEAFDTLEHLPSVEAVRALGEFLGDEEDPNALRPGDEATDTLGPGSNSGLATMALRSLIQDDPMKSKNGWLELGEIKAWQQWYEQIKAGNRTFRFEGDPTEYDLNGPASGQKLAHITRDRKRDTERQVGRERTSGSTVVAEPAVASKPFKSMPVAFFIAGFVLLGSLSWYFLKGRGRQGF